MFRRLTIIISGSILDPYRPFWIFVEVTAEYSFPDFHDFLVLKPACKTLKMTNAQVVETSVTVNNNSPTQDYVHPDDHTQRTYEGYVPLAFTRTISMSMQFLLGYTS